MIAETVPSAAVRTSAIALIRTLLTLAVAAALCAMMLLQFGDVVARKFLGFGIPGIVELIELMMLVVVFAGLPLASLKGEHVLFDLLDSWLPSKLKHLQSRLADLTCAVTLTGLGVLLLGRAARTASYGDVTPRLSIGLAGFHYGIAALLLLTAALHLGLALARNQPSGGTPEPIP